MDPTESILTVDDHASTRATLSRILAAKGYETDTAATGRDALKKVEARPFNVVLLDIRLPDVEGTDLLAPLREKRPDMAVILVTAYASIQTAIRALNEGAAAYITKPVDIDEALVTIRQVLGKQRLAVENRRLYQEAQRELAQRKQAEEALRESKELFEKTFRSQRDAIFILDGRSSPIVRDCNPAATEVFGYTRQEMLGRSTTFLHVDETALREFQERLYPAIAERGFLYLPEFAMKRKDRTVFPTEHSVIPLSDKQGKRVGWVSVVGDITEHKHLQDHLHQAEKMDAIGRLAGGIAHDFNNHLMVINNEARFLLNALDPEPLREGLEAICQAGESAAELTSRLMSFSRRKLPETRVLNLNHVLQALGTMLPRAIGADVTLVTKLADDLGSARADPGEIERVVMNLAINARDALPAGGTLTVETANVEMDETHARGYPGVEPGPFVLLTISDTGVGMTPEVRERIFEPFFTTKENGTGLGLTTVYRIVTQSGGAISVYSEPGRGTTFRIYLPRVQESPEKPQVRPSAQVLPHGSETILVLEDEDYVRSLALRMLRRLGYDVLEASEGTEALRLFRTCEEGVDLLLTDVVMPGMSGGEVVETLRRAHADLRVLYMSGHGDESAVNQDVAGPPPALIQKPFSIDMLAHKLREVLDVRAKQPPRAQ